MANVDFSTFIRTTDVDHKQAVQAMWKQLRDNQCIVEGRHQGYYSVNEEAFIPLKDLIETKDADGQVIHQTSLGETV